MAIPSFTNTYAVEVYIFSSCTFSNIKLHITRSHFIIITYIGDYKFETIDSLRCHDHKTATLF